MHRTLDRMESRVRNLARINRDVAADIAAHTKHSLHIAAELKRSMGDACVHINASTYV